MRPIVTSFCHSIFSLTTAPMAALLVGLILSEIAVAQAPIDTPQTNLAPIRPPAPNFTPPGSGYGQFDPYAPTRGGILGGSGTRLGIGGQGSGVTTIGPPRPIGPPATAPAPTSGSFFDRVFSQPTSPAPPSLSPRFGAPASGPVWNGPTGGPAYGPSLAPFDNSNVYGAPVGPAYGAPNGSPFPNTAYPSSSPTTLFPGGIFSGGFGSGYGPGAVNPVYSAYRLLRGPRLRHTYVGSGNSPQDFTSNDTDLSLVFAFPNFMYMHQPLYVVPSFSLHQWDGPGSSTGADLPSKAYSGFIDAGWQSDPNQMIGTEFGVRVGAFTDFQTFNSKSIRVIGKGLVHFRLSPTSTWKGGVYYINRRNYKLVPAVGLLWQPNPYTRADIFFPEPKFARYFTTIGTKDIWWYLSGRYGGGAWTITRASGVEDSIDINDLRVLAGFEWGESNSIRAGRRTAFFELGYVFNRDIEYRNAPADDIEPDDAFLIRAGIGY